MPPPDEQIKEVLRVLREANKGHGSFPRILTIHQLMARAKDFESLRTLRTIVEHLKRSDIVSTRSLDTEGLSIMAGIELLELPPVSVGVQIRSGAFSLPFEEVLLRCRR